MACAPACATALSVIVEVEFLVAVEKEGYRYDTATSGQDAEGTASQKHKWACPSQADDPSVDVLHQCKAVLAKDQPNVLIRHNETHLTGRSWQSARFDSWIVQPCHSSIASPSSPTDYDWSGVKLRSPLMGMAESELDGVPSPVNQCVETLRRAILIHVNASCRLSVSIRPRGNFTLVQAKKLATLVWLTERDLLAPLRLPNRHAVAVCPRPVATTSLTAVSRHGQIDNVREPLDPLLEGIMNSHLPADSRDTVTRDCLQRLWACSDLGHLSRALRDRQHNPLAFALYVYDDDAAEDSNTSYCAVATFRCALWHPRQGLDVSSHWTDLVLALGRAMSLTAEHFKNLVAAIDEMNCTSRPDDDAYEASHRTRLMKALGIGDARCAEWERIMADCKNDAP